MDCSRFARQRWAEQPPVLRRILPVIQSVLRRKRMAPAESKTGDRPDLACHPIDPPRDRLRPRTKERRSRLVQLKGQFGPRDLLSQTVADLSGSTRVLVPEKALGNSAFGSRVAPTINTTCLQRVLGWEGREGRVGFRVWGLEFRV